MRSRTRYKIRVYEMRYHKQLEEARRCGRVQLSLLISSLASGSRLSKLPIDWDRAGNGGRSPLSYRDAGNRQSTIISRPSVSVLALSYQDDHIILEEPHLSRNPLKKNCSGYPTRAA